MGYRYPPPGLSSPQIQQWFADEFRRIDEEHHVRMFRVDMRMGLFRMVCGIVVFLSGVVMAVPLPGAPYKLWYAPIGGLYIAMGMVMFNQGREERRDAKVAAVVRRMEKGMQQ